MKTFYTCVGIVVAGAFLVGCASPTGPNQASGTVMGAASGAVLGGVIAHNTGGQTGAGILIGSAIGALAGALVGKDIDDSTRARVAQGQPLTLDDIKALSKANVGDDLIISQINSTRTAYQLNSAQIIDLKNAGVSAKVVDYMINTPQIFAQPPPVPVERYYYAPPPPPPVYFYYGPVWYGPHHRW